MVAVEMGSFYEEFSFQQCPVMNNIILKLHNITAKEHQHTAEEHIFYLK